MALMFVLGMLGPVLTGCVRAQLELGWRVPRAADQRLRHAGFGADWRGEPDGG
jgi:hypothetical protein